MLTKLSYIYMVINFTIKQLQFINDYLNLMKQLNVPLLKLCNTGNMRNQK